MSRLTVVLFLTLVLFVETAWCATTQPSPDFRDSQSTAEEQTEADLTKTGLTAPTDPPPLPPGVRLRSSEYFYKYRRDFSMTATALLGDDEEGEKSPHFMFGLQHQFSDKALRPYELTAEIATNDTGLLSFSKRWNHSQSRFRPYHKLGLAVIIEPNDQLVTFLRLQHYLLRGGLGVEYSLRGSFSMRVEAISLIGTKSQQFGVAAMNVWGF